MNVIIREDYRCKIFLQGDLFCKIDRTELYGFPYKNSKFLADTDWLDKLNEIKGYYSFIKETGNTFYVGVDVIANYRLYYTVIDNELLISDSYVFLTEQVKNSNGNITLDKECYDLWKTHGFVYGEDTFFREIKKIPSSSYLKITKGGNFSLVSYFRDTSSIPSYNEMMKKMLADIQDSISALTNNFPTAEYKYLLFYSGGTDSTLLAYILKELKIPFTAIIIKYLPSWSMNYMDYTRGLDTAHRIGIEDIDVLEINLNEAKDDYLNSVFSDMLFDRHLAVHFYKVYELIKNKYGCKVIVLNGQAADSILSYGPSEYSYGDLLRRLILYTPYKVNKIFSPIVKKIMGKNFSLPKNLQEFSRAFLDEKKYFFCLDSDCTYTNLLYKYTKRGISQIHNKQALMMYFKMNGFLQGPDNQIVIKAALSHGIRNIVLPFATPQLIYCTIKYKSNLRECFCPKYFVRKTLKERFHYNSFYSQYKRKESILKDDFDMDKFKNSINDEWEKRINEILFD